MYYNAVIKGNSETGVARSPDSFYRLPTESIIIDAKVNTASGAPVSSAPSEINPPLRPDQLFFTTNVLDKCYISQYEDEHYKAN